MHPFVEISKRSSVPLAGDRKRLQRHLSRSGRVAGLLEEEWPGLFLIAPLLEGLDHRRAESAAFVTEQGEQARRGASRCQ
jgi:hypothetical protein